MPISQKKLKIEVYTVENCPFCEKVKAFLIQKNLAFEEIDGSNPQHAATLIEKTGGVSIPTTIFTIGNKEKILDSFNQQEFENAIESFKFYTET